MGHRPSWVEKVPDIIWCSVLAPLICVAGSSWWMLIFCQVFEWENLVNGHHLAEMWARVYSSGFFVYSVHTSSVLLCSSGGELMALDHRIVVCLLQTTQCCRAFGWLANDDTLPPSPLVSEGHCCCLSIGNSRTGTICAARHCSWWDGDRVCWWGYTGRADWQAWTDVRSYASEWHQRPQLLHVPTEWDISCWCYSRWQCSTIHQSLVRAKLLLRDCRRWC